MGILVLVLLVAAWGLVLGPALVRNATPSPMETEKMFRRALKALRGPSRQRTGFGGRWVLVPPSAEHPSAGGAPARRVSAAERRRQNLTYLATFIIATFLLGLFKPLRFLLFVNLVADAALISYLLAVVYFAARPGAVRPRGEVEAERPPEAAGGRW